MARIGYQVEPQKPDDDRRGSLQERMAFIRAERDKRRELYGPIDVAALVREVRDGSSTHPPSES